MSRTSTGPIHSKVEYDHPGGYSSLHMGLLVTGTKDSKPQVVVVIKRVAYRQFMAFLKR